VFASVPLPVAAKTKPASRAEAEQSGNGRNPKEEETEGQGRKGDERSSEERSDKRSIFTSGLGPLSEHSGARRLTSAMQSRRRDANQQRVGTAWCKRTGEASCPKEKRGRGWKSNLVKHQETQKAFPVSGVGHIA